MESKKQKREARTWARWPLGVAFVVLVTSLWNFGPAAKPPTLQLSFRDPLHSASVLPEGTIHTLNVTLRSPASNTAPPPQTPALRPFLAKLISQSECLRKNGHPELATRLQESFEEFETLLLQRGPQARFSNSKIAREWLSEPPRGVEEISLVLDAFEAEDFVSFRAELFQLLSLLNASPESDENLTAKKVAKLADQELLLHALIPAELDLRDNVSPHLALATTSFRLLISTARSELEAIEIGKRHIRLQPNLQVRESMMATLFSKYPNANEP